jgi:SAM-dependent methyltransferase
VNGLRKLFVLNELGGEDPKHWDLVWSKLDIEYELAHLVAGHDPVMRRLLEGKAPRSPIVEAGSGSGRVAEYLRRCGSTVFGVDFSMPALRECRGRLPSLPVLAADVSCLPFRAGSIASLVSIGVIEHFEEGPLIVLREHRRVLQSDGQLFLAVPRLSPLKRWQDWLRLTLRRRAEYTSWRGLVVTRAKGPCRDGTRANSSFYQYEFSRRLIVRFLDDTGFLVEREGRVSVSLGLRELGLARRLFFRLSRSGGAEQSAVVRARKDDRLRRLVSWESPATPIGGAFVWVLRKIGGHMHVFVARPREGGPDRV